jgi:radical S-adenosyl methionine domain-containing protein 2
MEVPVDPKVVNLHLLDACDFRCAHCFAHFGADKTLYCGQWKAIVDNILNGMAVERFNLAGGEPLLYSSLEELAEHIRSRGSAVSLITNGRLLSPQRIDRLVSCGVSMIGLSIDSAQESTLHALGRRTETGKILDPGRCLKLCEHIRARGIALKINTVVSRINHTEDLGSFIKTASPCRWKILKIKSFRNDRFDNSPLMISDAEFDSFVRRHHGVPVRRVVEWTMAGAYIMVDAMGNLIDTESCNNTPAANLLAEDFAGAFRRLNFNYRTYNARYVA